MRYFHNKNLNQILGYSEESGIIVYEALPDINVIGDIHHILPEKNMVADGGTFKKGVGKGNGVRKCKSCGKVGHRKETCPKGTSDDEDAPAYETPKDLKSALADIDEDAFDGIKKLQDLNYSSKEAADECGRSIAVVNKIFSFKRYIDFERML